MGVLCVVQRNIWLFLVKCCAKWVPLYTLRRLTWFFSKSTRTCASTVLTMEGKIVNSNLAPTPYTVSSIRGITVFIHVAPHLFNCISTRLVFFFSYFSAVYTQWYIHPRTLLHCHIQTRVFEFSNSLNTNDLLPILIFETSFGILESRAFDTYQIHNDLWSFLVRVFRDFTTSRLVLIEILVSIICEADPVILRISRGTTYLNFIKF